MPERREREPMEEGGVRFFARPEVAQGTYSNFAVIRHSPEEFQIDFFVRDLDGAHHLVARILTNPYHMKRLVKALTENLRKYEEKFGGIAEKGLKNLVEL